MKNSTRLWLSLIVVIVLSNFAAAQTSLGSSKTFMKNLKKELAKNQKTVSLKVENSKTFTAKINFKESNASGEFLVGEIKDVPESSFYINVKNKSLEGHIIFNKTKKAYKYYSDAQGNAYVSKEDINKLICIDYPKASQNPGKVTSKAVAEIAPALLHLQSLPGAPGCVLLDFDGYYMPPGNLWNNGNAINAAPSGMSDADILEFWELVAEDYRPFNLNITTSEEVYNSYPKNRRMRTVVTPTQTARPGVGGVAYVGSFNWDNDVPCWAFELSGKNGGEVASHEVGHTFDLSHDGLEDGAEYFVGVPGTSWAPIMGTGYYREVVQWSKGEYNNASNKEDDIAIISGPKFGIGFRPDDYGDNAATASNIEYNMNGIIYKKDGIISTLGDQDLFTFTTKGGNVAINVNTVSRNGNIHLAMRLFDDSGSAINAYYNPDPFVLNISLNVNLPAGKYFLRVIGIGAGYPVSGGYSSYDSLGSYSITGIIPPSAISASSDVITVYKDCNYEGFSAGLTIGDYDLDRLNSLGILNDDISSLRVAEGFQAILYHDDNFTGTSTIITSNNSCLDTFWNNKVTSVRILANGVTDLGNATYFLQNQNSFMDMTVLGSSTANGANIIQGDSRSAANQKFTFTHLGHGLYKIIANNSNKSLDVNNSSKLNGANVVQNEYSGTPSQQFVVVAAGIRSYKLIARHSGKLVEVAGGDFDEGANVQQWENNNQTWGQWRLFSTTVGQTSRLIQAEDYSAMSGIQTETTTDTGGGLHVGYTDRGDWLTYNNINFPTSGAYLIEYRVASAVNGAKISADLNEATIQFGRVNIPNTGGWQKWQTVSQTVNVNAGTYNFGISIRNSGVNINWIRITKAETGAIVPENSWDIANEEKDADFLNIYPNPVENTLFITTDLTGGNISIIDSQTGSLVKTHEIRDNSINVSGLNRGVYLIVFDKDGKRTVKRFIKK
ncbi:RICIN domain-containing protein [[Flexibacter] sp. ATCC 35103]|uniref:RICIN domain-containing protein n=1 Tax=[Flexibacter] sp. ATCC 35103 TaxID=1937528 RepID=UPI0009C98C97|nr:RICIN domain-containing protein [[Flexibacter] sp. ATCC 35103]OMQ10413.1 hypothetical protein BXU01_14135 [[Flexibacter] sp. ATCC 35103]